MNISGFTTTNRLTGIASGLDTDELVSSLMKAEKAPLDRLYQKKQLAEWKRDDYREITNLLRGFKSEYMDSINSSKNMLSQSVYKKFTASSTVTSTGETSTVVSATGNANASAGTHTISVEQLATSLQTTSTGTVTKQLESGDVSGELLLNGKSMEVTIDGVTHELTFSNDYAAGDKSATLATDLEDMINDAFGLGIGGGSKVSVSYASNTLTFTTQNGANKITIEDGSDTALTDLGITSGASNRLDMSQSLSTLSTMFATELTFTGGQISFTINDQEFTFDESDTLSNVISTINSDSEANVTMEYSEITDKFTITSKQMGAGENIRISETAGNFFSGVSNIAAGNYRDGDVNTTGGQDAKVVLDGETILRGTNDFTVNGITYSLLAANPGVEQTVETSLDVDSIVDSIVQYANKYNEVIESINNKLSEEYNRNYTPLTDDQKESMTDDEIEKWEEKAKTGLLRYDSILQGIVTNMRKALSDPIEGVSINLSSIGITTGGYEDKGKLTIDETSLREAISNNPDAVMNLFSQRSTTQSTYSRTSSMEEKSARYNEEGLAHRLFDVIEDNISILRDSNGNKGLLLEKAGITGDSSEYDNYYYNNIKDYESSITDWLSRLEEKENNYYKKFTALEKALSDMNTQASWLSFQTGE